MNLQAEDCLAVALNWKRWAIVTSPIARRFIQTVPPSAAALAASLQWLLRDGPLAANAAAANANAAANTTAAAAAADCCGGVTIVVPREVLQAGILQYPEAYLVAPQRNYERALKTAPSAYRDPDQFRALLCRDPSVLQCTYNCADSGCNSDCGNCWVSFEYKSAIATAKKRKNSAAAASNDW